MYAIFTSFLLLSNRVSANILVPRQETSPLPASESVGSDRPTVATASESDVPERPTIPTDSAESDATTPSATPTSGADSAASNGTAEASSISSTVSATATSMSKPLNGTEDGSKCHKNNDQEKNQNVFCEPVMGERIEYGAEYRVTWDSSLFPDNSTTMVAVYNTDSFTNTSLDFPEKLSLALFQTNPTPNINGRANISIYEDFLAGDSTVNLTLSLAVSSPDEPRYAKPGPTIVLENKKASNGSSDSNSGSEEELSQKVGIPIGLVVFLVILAGLIFFVLRRRRAGAKLLTGKSQSQRTVTPALAGPHRRQSSFHDEPTRGMELQDRRSGEDNWGWSSPTTSPTSGDNVFREEIGRQRTGRGW